MEQGKNRRARTRPLTTNSRDVFGPVSPPQRLVGLDEAHAVLALPLLRALSSDYIKKLPQDIQDEVQRR